MSVFRNDPYPAYNFEVTFTGISDDGSSVKGAFSEVSGLGVEFEVIEYRVGIEKVDTPRKLVGLHKFPNIVLKRGIIGDLTFWNWLAQTMKGQNVRTDGTIVLLDEQHQPVMMWKFFRAWPCKWEGPMLNAKNNEVAIETLEICHEGLETQ